MVSVWLFLTIASACAETIRLQNDGNAPSFWTYPVWYESRSGRRSPPQRRPRAVDDDRDVASYKSDVETPRDVPTRPDYENGGSWAEGHLPGKDVDVGFVPQKVYTQVRRFDTVRHLPRSAAVKEAATYEELVNAPRLREVLSHKQIQQVYEEEGYEDAGYDHGGYNHQGELLESKEKNEKRDAQKRQKDAEPGSTERLSVTSGGSDESSKYGKNPGGVRWKRFHTESQTKEMSWDENDSTKSVGDEIAEVTESMKDSETVTAKSELKQLTTKSDNETSASLDESSAQAIEKRFGIEESIEAAESHNSATVEKSNGRELPVEARVINDPRPKGSSVVTFPGRHTRRQYAMGRPVDVYVQESVGYGVRRPVYGVPVTSNVHHYLPVMPAFPSYYTDNPAAYTAQLITQRLPNKQAAPAVQLATTTSTSMAPPIDTGPVKFMNSADTLATFANLFQQATSTSHPVPDDGKYDGIIEPRYNSTLDVHMSATTNNQKVHNSTSRRRPSRFRYPVSNARKQYNNFTRVVAQNPSQDGHSGKSHLEVKNPSPHTRHPSIPRDSTEEASNDPPLAIAEALAVNHELPYTPNRPQDPVKYIESLTVAHFANTANVPMSPPSVQNERLKELARQLNARNDDSSRKTSYRILRRSRRNSEITYDQNKYPFYDSFHGISQDSALRYVSNPDEVPRKSLGGMEFYESRNRLVKCMEPQPPEDVIPERDDDGEWDDRPQPKDLPRVKGVGASIDCLKRRYFGSDPLDNPFFQEAIGEPQMYDSNTQHSRKIRSAPETQRLMIIPPRNDNSSKLVYRNNSERHFKGEHRANGHTNFPFKNHKPESAEVSASVHNLRGTSPYKYYSEYDTSYFPDREIPQKEADDADGDDSKKYNYYHHGYKHKYVRKKKKRYKPSVHHFYPKPPLPVSIYSVIAGSNNVPVYHKPIVYTASANTNKVIPIYHIEATRPHRDSYGSDSKISQQAAPTRWYIVRPGEYTENKDFAADNKPSSSGSFWSYINPLKWWFPSYFDERRNEPKRRRRSTEQELFNRILARTTNATVEPKVFESHKTNPSTAVSTTGAPISINEFKARINATDRRGKVKNRLTGGFLTANTYSTTIPPFNNLNTPLYTDPKYGQIQIGTTPVPMTQDSVSTTNKPKVTFPRTKTPSKRRMHGTKKSSVVGKNVLTTITTTSTTTTTPSTTTRMYKPKRVVKKNFDRKTPVDAFSVLKRGKSPSSPFESIEASASGDSGSVEEPRRLQQVEHRRVTKEEVYKTSYIPEDEGRVSRNGAAEESRENYSTSTSTFETTMEPDDHTLTYMVNPVTGVGSWGEQPRRSTWKPKKRYPKRHLDKARGSPVYKASYDYPTSPYPDTVKRDSSKKNKKRHSSGSPYDHKEYIAGLMNQVHPGAPTASYSRLRSLESIEADVRQPMDDSSATAPGSDESVKSTGSDESVTLPPIKSPPKFIMDPGKRKYFYVKI